MVRTAPTIVRVSSRPRSENMPTVMSTSCRSATIAPTEKESSKRKVTKIKITRMPRQSEQAHAGKKAFAEEVDVLRRNQMQHRDALQPSCIDKPTETVTADDESRE